MTALFGIYDDVQCHECRPLLSDDCDRGANETNYIRLSGHR